MIQNITRKIDIKIQNQQKTTDSQKHTNINMNIKNCIQNLNLIKSKYFFIYSSTLLPFHVSEFWHILSELRFINSKLWENQNSDLILDLAMLTFFPELCAYILSKKKGQNCEKKSCNYKTGLKNESILQFFRINSELLNKEWWHIRDPPVTDRQVWQIESGFTHLYAARSRRSPQSSDQTCKHTQTVNQEPGLDLH